MGSLRINIGSAFNRSCMQKPMVVDLVSMKICLLHVYSMLRANAVGCEVFMDIISNTAGYSWLQLATAATETAKQQKYYHYKPPNACNLPTLPVTKSLPI